MDNKMYEGKMIKRERESNIDLLRIIATFAVIVIHVSAIYKTAVTSDHIFGFKYTNNLWTIIGYNSFSIFAVPVFMMISGAYLLSNDDYVNSIYFYKKRLLWLLRVTFISSLLYVVYRVVKLEIMFFIQGSMGELHVFDCFIDWIKGVPFYHLWYLYTLIGVYLFVPTIVKLRMELSSRAFLIATILITALSEISVYTSRFEISWSISKSICYVSFLMIGYQLRTLFASRKSNFIGVMIVILGMSFFFITARIEYIHALKGMSECESVVGNFNPIVLMASCFVFSGFNMLNIKIKIKDISSVCFWIYIVHAGILDVMLYFLAHYASDLDCRVVIPLLSILVFVLSICMARIIITVLNVRIIKNEIKE